MSAEEPDRELYEVALTGHQLLDNPILNKGSGFSLDERRDLGLLGLLPAHPSTMDEQLLRVYENYKKKTSDLERYIFLGSLHDRNETLFYRLLQGHITEMMPIIYTPTVGLGCQNYSHLFRRPRGLYISYPHRDELDLILDNAGMDPSVIVVTDGERILGLGDLGVGGMGIPVGKLALYTLCAGINPDLTLPILLDVGTNNKELLADPLYLGWRHERIKGQVYDDFVEAFVSAVTRKFPKVLLQWEDFAKDNASRLLERYKDRLCTFNDDIQGTGAVTLAGLLAAMKSTGSKLNDQTIVLLGAGSAAAGISGQIVAAMIAEGTEEKAAVERIWLIDSRGLVHSERTGLEPFKQKFARDFSEVADWKLTGSDGYSLIDVVRNLHPTVLIGTSAQAGAFNEAIVREMAKHVERPVIFPLSNPTSKSEAAPSDIISWTEGRAIVATGSPFPEFEYAGRTFRTGQCNNAFIFPGVGLGVISSGARRVTNEMFVVAARVLAEFSPALNDAGAPLYPSLEIVQEISRHVAIAVGREAQRSGLAAETTQEELVRLVENNMWTPSYVEFKRKVV